MFKNIGVFNNRKILHKLIFTLLITSLSVVAILSAMFYYWIRDKALNDVNTITELTLHNIIHSITGTFTSTENVTYEIFNNSIINDLSRNEDILSVIKASDYLNTLLSVNSYIRGIHIFNDRDIILSKSNGYDSSYERIYGLMERNKVLAPIHNGITDYYGNRMELLTFIYHENNTNRYNHNLYVAIDIDSNDFKKLVNIDYKNAFSYLLILNSNNEIIMSFSNNGYENRDFENLIATNVINSNQDIKNMRLEDNGKRHIINYLFSEDERYCIIAAKDLDIFNLQVLNIKNILINSIVMLLVCIMVISLIVSKKLYIPINVFFDNVRKYIQDSERINNELTESSSLSKSVDEMVDKINAIGSKGLEEYSYIRHLLLKELVAGQVIDNKTNIISKMDEYKVIPERDKPFVLILFKISGLKELSNASAKIITMNDLLKIEKRIENGFNENNLENKMIEIFNNEIITIANVKPHIKLKECFDKVLEEIRSITWNESNILLSIGISSMKDDISDIQKAYTEAHNLACLRIVYGNGIIMFPKESEVKAVNNDETVRGILESIRNCDEKGFLYYLDAFLENCKSMDYQSILAALMNLCRDIFSILHDIGTTNSMEINEIHMMEILKKVEDRNELYYFFKGIYKDIENYLNNINNNKTINNLKSVIEYISDNYPNSNLTASLVAEKISITPQHFSKLFKRYTGISFPDYLNNIRLSKAKELFDNDNSIGIKEVSSAVGYSNCSYFSLSFKKRYGITPTGYRQNIQEFLLKNNTGKEHT